MASLVNGLKSVASGRTLIGITGIYDNKEVTVDLDLVDSWVATHSNTISSHTIEKNLQDGYSQIIDHVNVTDPVIRLSAYLSDNLNLLSSTASTVSSAKLTNKAVSAKEKLKYLLSWQAKGFVVKIEGYGTGGSSIAAFKKFVSFLDKGTSAFYNSDLKDANYLGLDTDIIDSLVIGSITSTRKPELGNDIEISIDIQRVKFGIPKTSKRGIATGSGSGSRATAGKPPEKASTQAVKEESKISSSAKTNFAKKG